MSFLGVGLPEQASREGARLDPVLNASFAALVVVFVLALVAMLWLVTRRRRATLSGGAGVSRASMVRTVCFAVALFALLDGALFVNAVRADPGADLDLVDARPDVTRIEVEARQWAWDARYAGPDGKFSTRDDVLSLDRLLVPVDAPVLVELASPDVIHSFSVPALRVKRDAVPGHVTALAFTPTRLGQFEIACAQLCGVNHYKMRGVLEVVTRGQYAAWLARTADESSRAFDPADVAAHWAWPWSARR